MDESPFWPECPGFLRLSTSIGSVTLVVEPGSPGENGYVKSFNRGQQDEYSSGELFLSRVETRYVVDR